MIVSSQRSLLEQIESITVPLALHMPARPAGDRIPHEHLKPLMSALKHLSESYTGEVKIDGSHVLSSDHVRAYLLYYLPLNAVKVHHLLKLVSDQFQDKSELSILDYGCGPGTASLAAALTLNQKIAIHGVDKSAHMREGAKGLLTALSHKRPVSFVLDQTLPEHNPKFDIIFACNVLNELTAEEQRYFLVYALEALSEKGVLIVLEPGTLRATRMAMEHRDSIVELFPSAIPFYPCTHTKSCPLLLDPHQWCHTELLFDRTTLFHQLDELSGFNKHMIKYSAFIFGKNGTLRTGYRAITEAEKSKIGSSAYLCGDTFAGLVQLQKRNRNDANRAFDKVSMHDRVLITPPLVSKDITSEMSVISAL